MSGADAVDPAAQPAAGESPRTAGPTLGTLFRISLTVLLSAYVLWQAGVSESIGTLAQADIRYVVVALSSAFVAMTLNVKRWQMMLGAQGEKVRLGTLVRLYLISMFFNNILPSRFGGDVVRAIAASRLGATKTRSVAAILMDRLVGGISVLLLGVIAVAFVPSVVPYSLGIVMLSMLLLAGVILGMMLLPNLPLGILRSRLMSLTRVKILGFSVESRVDAAIDAIRMYSRFPWLVAYALLISMLANGISVINLWLYSVSVNAGVSLAQIAVIAPVVLAVGLLPVSINGIGTTELTFVTLMGAMGVDPPVALAVALLRRFALLFLSLVGGALLIVRRL